MDIVRFLIPRIPLKSVFGMIAVTVAGALVGGLYGVLHDQITYTISEEYFTRFKFFQFYYAKPTIDSPRLFAGIIGFLATWWVGGLTAWVLARVSVSREGGLAPVRELAAAFGVVFLTAIIVAGLGWCWGLWRKTTGYAVGWLEWMDAMQVSDWEAFMTVGYIHNASYLGGCLGMLLGILYLRRARRLRLPENEKSGTK